jgi:hypothetical protein
MAIAALNSERKDNVWTPFPSDFLTRRQDRDWGLLVTSSVVMVTNKKRQKF